MNVGGGMASAEREKKHRKLLKMKKPDTFFTPTTPKTSKNNVLNICFFFQIKASAVVTNKIGRLPRATNQFRTFAY